MKNIPLLKIIICCLAASLLLTAAAQAQPSRNTILGDLEIVDKKDHSIIRIGFTFPVRYIRHYPLKTGDELRIQLRAIAINPDDIEDLFQRESIPPKVGNPARITDVVYEGSDIEGRFLTLFFEEAVTFKVEQGSDYRSLQVTVYPIKIPSVSALPAEPVSNFYAVNMASAVVPFDLTVLSTVKVSPNKTLYVTKFNKDGQLWHRLRLGFFPNFKDAKRELAKIIKRFPRAWVTKVSDRERKQALLQKPVAPTAGVPAPLKPDTVIRKKVPTALKPNVSDSPKLLVEADSAMEKENYGRAIQLYTKLAKAEDTGIREQAQQKLGLAREMNGQMAHAKAEYRRYLELYPQGIWVKEVNERLDNILKSGRPAGMVRRDQTDKESRWRKDLHGSFSQFYYRNESYTDASGNVLSRSLLNSNLDFNFRVRNDEMDIQSVFVGGHDEDLLYSDDSESRVRSAYINLYHKSSENSARLGRQTSSSGGVLGRFDGASLGFQLLDKVRLNLVGGFPVHFSTSGVETDKYFYGFNFDLGTLADHWDFNTFFINQETDKVTDRRAIGGEVRYFNPKGTFFSLVDYDIFYNELNTFLLVGNYTFSTGTILNFSADYRQSPALTTSNALIGRNNTSLDQLIDTLGENTVKDLARNKTAVFRMASLGITQPINQKLQVASDISWFKLDGTEASEGVEEIIGIDNEYFYSLQLIGNSLIKEGDLAILGLRYGDTATSDIYTININTRYPLTRAWRINPRLIVDFRKNHESSSDQVKIRPSLRTDYRWNKYLHFELEGGMEWSSTSTPDQQDDDSRGYFLIVGSRINF